MNSSQLSELGRAVRFEFQNFGLIGLNEFINLQATNPSSQLIINFFFWQSTAPKNQTDQTHQVGFNLVTDGESVDQLLKKTLCIQYIPSYNCFLHNQSCLVRDFV